MKELTSKKLFELIDALDEFITINHHRFYPPKEPGIRKVDLLRRGQSELVAAKLCTSQSVAQRFQNEYRSNPTRALILLICDHLHPTSFNNKKVRISLPSNIYDARDMIWTMVK